MKCQGHDISSETCWSVNTEQSSLLLVLTVSRNRTALRLLLKSRRAGPLCQGSASVLAGFGSNAFSRNQRRTQKFTSALDWIAVYWCVYRRRNDRKLD